MKLVINYDFFNAILDVNQKFIPMKVFRNRKKYLVFVSILYLFGDYYIFKKRMPELLSCVVQQTSGCFMTFCMFNCIAINIGGDFYKDEGQEKLKKLVSDLKNIYVNTDYDLLLNSELIKRKYKVQLNENKIPELMEEKYILVPTNDFSNNIKNVSIKQEHIIGSTDYVLSVGSPKKELKLAYSNV
ncbi:MAG: hypothetical protein IJ068_04230 [Bacilli bacterium]|nr:hypothetical protein [Bacilli bacterium]